MNFLGPNIALKAGFGTEVAEFLAVDRDLRRRLSVHAWVKFHIAGADVEDLLQETALELLREGSLIRNPGAFVFQVFHRQCCSYVGRIARQRALDGITYEVSSEAGARGLGADDRLALSRGLAFIPSRSRRVLWAYYGEGRSLRETAEKTGVAESSAWTLIQRCLRKLRRSMGADGLSDRLGRVLPGRRAS